MHWRATRCEKEKYQDKKTDHFDLFDAHAAEYTPRVVPKLARNSEATRRFYYSTFGVRVRFSLTGKTR